MSYNHSISDLVTRIRNGYMVKKTNISSPSSKLREGVLKVLKEEGYISNYSKKKDHEKHEEINIHLKYHNSIPVVAEIEVVSKPGRKVYCSSKNIPLVKNGLGVLILSTSKGIVSDYTARINNLGGKILLKIF